MGSAIFNWSCYSIPNTMMVEYLLRSLIFSRDQHIFIIYLFTEKNKYIHIQSNDFSLWLLCTPTFGLKGWMAWENSRKGTRGFCILVGLRKRCGAVWNFYFKSWKQQLQLWLKAKRGQLLKKKRNQLSLEEACSVLISSCASGPLVCFLWFWHFANGDFNLYNQFFF